MAQLDFFRNSNQQDPDFFDEGPKIVRSQILTSGVFHNTGGIDTSAIDGFRQGVELTQIKYFDAGTVKISAGTPGSVLVHNHFGEESNFRYQSWFEELDYFNPQTFLESQAVDSPLYSNIITFPIITSDNDQIENYLFDGVIEPFTIRARAAFFSIEVPFVAHEVKGAVMGGNTDTTWAADLVETVYLNDLKENLPFLDQYADTVAFAEQQAASGHASTIVGFFSADKPVIAPFVDARYPRNAVIDVSYGTDMDAALSLMSGSTDGYINLALGLRSAPAGWDYSNNVGVGTDTLAFGGRLH